MNEPLSLILPLGAGILLGTIFFGGLCCSVRKGVSSRRTAFWFLGSLLLRMSLGLVGFYFVGSGHWEQLVLCLLGFVMARFLVAWRTRPPGENQTRSAQEPSQAP